MENIKITEDSFILDDGNYRIDFERINTPEKLLGWTYHLLEKNWMTPMQLREFMSTVSTKLNVTIDYHA